MAPVTDFAVKDTYKYLSGFNNYHQSEALPGALPAVINSPQKPAYGLRTERISNTSFVAAREKNYQTWLYRAVSSLEAGTFVPFNESDSFCANPAPPKHLTPNSYMWPSIPMSLSSSSSAAADWTTGQKLLGRNGDPQQKQGMAVWLFGITDDMPLSTAFSSLDGETLIVLQAGCLDIQTEMGRLLVRQNEIAVIPRGVRYRVSLKAGAAEEEDEKGDGTEKNKKKAAAAARGYMFELFEGHLELPTLGIIGSTGLANARDFEVPTAFFDDDVVIINEKEEGEGGGDKKGEQVEVARDKEWRIVSRLNGKLWTCTQDHTPFDVVAWHGLSYPYKYDLERFCALGNTRFDHHDPSLFVVLTAPAFGKAPGTAVLDFAIVPARWQTAKDTLWIPYYHRNVMQEFYFPIVSSQSPTFPFNNNNGVEFGPFACGLNGSMATHGTPDPEFRKWSDRDTSKPEKLDDNGITIALVETEQPLYLSDWAYELAVKNMNGQHKAKL